MPAERGNGRIQEAEPGEALHVEKKAGGSLRALVVASWWLGSNHSLIKLLGQNTKKGRDMDTSSLRDDLKLKIECNYS
jgi:hypothetical protein